MNAVNAPSAPPAFDALGALPERVNIAGALAARAAEAPERVAVRSPRGGRGWRDTSYDELAARAAALARGLASKGIRPGDRACVFVRPSPELLISTYALFALGAVPVLIDPGMGRRQLLACVERMAPRVFLGIAEAQVARLLYARPFRSVELAVSVGPGFGLGTTSLRALERCGGSGALEPTETLASEDAAVLFTSGSTGPPKGVRYSHGMFHAQRLALSALFELQPGEVDVACFPLFALFDCALGLTSVIPRLDPSRPGSCRPAQVAAAIEQSNATLSFGSPAIWRRVAPWCADRGVRLESLRRVLVAGAPVPPELVEALRAILAPDADVHTPYGATEALPVSAISGAEILSLRERTESGEGTCVGRAAPGIEIGLAPIEDEARARWEPERAVGRGEAGEICVRGPVVTQEYAAEPEATLRAKLAPAEESGPLWHRMGDVGRLDEQGRLWFLGRVAHRIETAEGIFMPVPEENIYNSHPGVARTALVGVGQRGKQRPVLVVERADGVPREAKADALAADICAFGREHGARLVPTAVLFHAGFPVDVRHNAKIHRLELARWAEERLG